MLLTVGNDCKKYVFLRINASPVTVPNTRIHSSFPYVFVSSVYKNAISFAKYFKVTSKRIPDKLF